ncbi:MAG TPA: Stf0 family sulfotransferase [Croceibacterium sp.]|nr:Stf0 family sulfotransferase [Croceibacterium sp.]
MIDHVVTGYEAEFDFPLREPAPERPYLFASVPRSGSTFVSHLLWATGCLGAPLEYLNFEPAGPYGQAHGSPEAQSAIWRSVLQRRTSPNGVFGLKAFPMQLEWLNEANPMLVGQVMRTLFPRGRPLRMVQLRRRDATAHAISYARALLSGIWRKEQEPANRPEPAYSSAAVEHGARLIAEQEAAWAAMCRDLRVDPLVIWYEDALAEPERTIASVAAYLGVALDPAAAIAVPAIERQSQAGARDWADRHAGR